MKKQFNPGSAILLLAVLLLNASGLCYVLGSNDLAHACCHKTSGQQHAVPSRCCLVSSAPQPAGFVAPSAPGGMASTCSPRIVQAHFAYCGSTISHSSAPTTARVFLKFHQLLI